MRANASTRLALAIVSCLATSAISGCLTVRVVVEPPAECPLPGEAVVLEMAKMRMEGSYTNTVDWYHDEIIPFCAGVNGMAQD